jgi:MFS family permease
MVVLQQDWQLTEMQTSTITFSVFASALLGSLTLGPLGDLVGRQSVFMLAANNISFFRLLPADNFRMNTGMVDTAPLIIWLL